MGRPTCYASPRLEGREGGDKGGRGVFARERIARGELLVVFAGTVLLGEELAELAADQRRLVLQVDENHYLLSEVEGCADWVNHCCQPNAGLRGQVTLVAMRDIEAGEEICYDYAMSDGSPYDDFDCRCGRVGCRTRISGDDWMLEELWERYRGHFSPYLQARIDALAAARPARKPAARRRRQPTSRRAAV
ncbi:MAG TPA: SET domain-containing protein [Kofleriaceae bacterium]|nr:SET domain-containing protein [Kofleriaceae bacterium]